MVYDLVYMDFYEIVAQAGALASTSYPVQCYTCNQLEC